MPFARNSARSAPTVKRRGTTTMAVGAIPRAPSLSLTMLPPELLLQRVVAKAVGEEAKAEARVVRRISFLTAHIVAESFTRRTSVGTDLEVWGSR